MSYRTCINGTQVFGNNEYYPEWIEFIESQGIEVNDEGLYEGEIFDFMGALATVEKITLRLSKERDERKKNLLEKFPEYSKLQALSLFDWTDIPKKCEKGNESLFDQLYDAVRNGYAFMPYALYLACQDKLQKDDDINLEVLEGMIRFHRYKIKPGETIHVSAS